jgi:hypothetical protein
MERQGRSAERTHTNVHCERTLPILTPLVFIFDPRRAARCRSTIPVTLAELPDVGAGLLAARPLRQLAVKKQRRATLIVGSSENCLDYASVPSILLFVSAKPKLVLSRA